MKKKLSDETKLYQKSCENLTKVLQKAIFGLVENHRILYEENLPEGG